MPTRRPLLVLLTLIATLAGSGSAMASPSQISMMMDDDSLLYRSPKTADRTLDTMARLGVDYVRLTVLWKVVGERARNTKAKDRRFRKLGAENPRSYPKGNWDRYDHVIRSAGARGIGVYLNLTGPGPAWCCPKPPRGEEENRETWRPKPREFKNFVKAVGTRYSGRYRDENTRRAKLPRVSFWSLWNEPNQGGWLTPQWWKGKATSPQLFRDLYIKGREGLVATGHGADVILLGETAPNGKNDRTRSRSPMYPTTFIRSLFCVDGAGNRRAGAGCDAFVENGPLEATAFAHHPYTKDLAPGTPDRSRDAITMANLDTLTGLLDAIANKTGRVAAEMPIALTEFGYETQPPDPYNGVSLAEQADYSNIADAISWLNPRVISQTQFLLRDVKPISSVPKTSRRHWFTYQSGLYFNNGRPKPAALAYRFPFLAQKVRRDAQGRMVYGIWGQARFRPNNVREGVFIQHRPTGSKTWSVIGDPIGFHGRNYFTGSVTSPGPGVLRAIWPGRPKPEVSRTQTAE